MTQLTQEYFDEQFQKLATKDDVTAAVEELARIVNGAFEKVEERLNKIEALLIQDHTRRIERLENDLGRLKEALLIK